MREMREGEEISQGWGEGGGGGGEENRAPLSTAVMKEMIERRKKRVEEELHEHKLILSDRHSQFPVTRSTMARIG